MKQISNNEYEEWLKYKEEKAKGHVLMPDTVRFICAANNYDPNNIGRYFLEILPQICPSGNLYGVLGNRNQCFFFWRENEEINSFFYQTQLSVNGT